MTSRHAQRPGQRRQVTLPANGWEPRPYQIPSWNKLLNPDIKTAVLAWHRRAGKDDIALHGLAIRALQRTANYMYCLPQYNQARKAIWEAINPHTGRNRVVESFPSEIIRKKDNQTMMLELINGSTIQLVGSDQPDSLVGTPPAGIVFSEAGLSNPIAYGLLRPILIENSGWSWHISSVRGQNHFYEAYKIAKDDPLTSYASHLSAHDTGVFTDHQLAVERAYYRRHFGRAIGDSLFEQEYLSRWDAAVVGAVFGDEMQDMTAQGRALPFVYDPRYPVDTSWDIGVNDPTVILFWQTVGNQERMIDWYQDTDHKLSHYARYLNSKPYFYGKHLVPHDGARREWGGGSIIKQARDLGLKITPTPNLPKETSIALASNLLERVWINADPEHSPDDVTDDCHFVFNALKNYRFKYDKERRVMSKTPIHDWTSHIADALMVKAFHAANSTDLIATSHPDAVLPDDHQLNSMRLRDILNARRRQSGGAWG